MFLTPSAELSAISHQDYCHSLLNGLPTSSLLLYALFSTWQSESSCIAWVTLSQLPLKVLQWLPTWLERKPSPFSGPLGPSWPLPSFISLTSSAPSSPIRSLQPWDSSLVLEHPGCSHLRVFALAGPSAWNPGPPGNRMDNFLTNSPSTHMSLPQWGLPGPIRQ